MPRFYRNDPLMKEAEAVDWSKFDKAPATCPNCGETFAGHEAYLAHYRAKHDEK